MSAIFAWSDLKEFRQSVLVKYIHVLTYLKKTRASAALKMQTILETPCYDHFQGSVCEDKAASPCSTFPE